MVSVPETAELEATGAKFLEALRSQDWAELQSCFTVDVQFRALIPPGLREGADAVSAVGYLSRWFGDADELVLVTSALQRVEDRLSISYRFRVHEDQWYVVEQRAYCEVRDGQIERIDLLCSGFHPEAEQSSADIA
jgi:hypothetical protein